MTEPIPQPPKWPIIGNALELDPVNNLASLTNLTARYGPIFKIDAPGLKKVIVSDYALAKEVFDEKRFRKSVSGSLAVVRNGMGSGLFTAYWEEKPWELAHRILVPAFGPLSIHGMFDEMLDIGTQLIIKWSKFGETQPILVSSDFTRLTLDSIALCAMDTRFNSFYLEDFPPFATAMTGFLRESGRRSLRTATQQYFMRESNRKYAADIEFMRKTAQECLDKRRAHPSDKKDLLNAMLFGKDPKTGEGLDDKTIMDNMLTFLVAGHETTSGMLSFWTYFLCKNPAVYRKLQAEVDEVLGTGPIAFEHTLKLPYIEASLKEALRLYPPASSPQRESRDGSVQILAGKYEIPGDYAVQTVLPLIQRDRRVYGEDADDYRPERWLGEAGKAIPDDAWRPFGSGARSCIGRNFAWQEAIMIVAMIMQNFDLRLVDPSYEMRLNQTLTIKPDNLQVYAIPRGDHSPAALEKRLFGGLSTKHDQQATHTPNKVSKEGKPLTILYGSNTGTSEGLAQSLASSATGHGFAAKVATLDSAVDSLPAKDPVVIITASFEGEPADNAAQFVEWLKTSSGKFEGVQYAVFGCGHHDWAATFHKIPKLIDSTLADKGAKRLADFAGSDVALGTTLDDFDKWQDEVFWPAVGGKEDTDGLNGANALNVQITNAAHSRHLKQSVNEAEVVRSDLLSGPGTEEKRVVQFKLPTDVSYTAGDYLNILPPNPSPTVRRVLSRFGIAWDAEITIQPGSHTSMPIDKQMSVYLLLAHYVELSTAATKKNVIALRALSENPSTQSALDKINANEDPKTKPSVLDILDKYPDLAVPFGLYLSMLPPMRIRQYSISSSPLADPTTASITYHVLESPIPGTDHKFLGVTTNHLKGLKPGDKAQISLKESHYSFHLPSDPAQPIIMICAGTGLAPFRGFVEERAIKISHGQKLGKALLFVGCQDPESDRLYAQEFEEWEKAGAVEVYYAFSRKPEASKGCKHAQDRLLAEKESVRALFADNAKIFVCGAGRLGNGVRDVSIAIHKEGLEAKGQSISDEESAKWFDSLKVQERWSSDIFG